MGQAMKKRMVWSCGEAYLEETKLFHSSPGADVGKAGLWETRQAVSEAHGSLDVVMVHLLGRVVRSGYGRICHQLALPSSCFFSPAPGALLCP